MLPSGQPTEENANQESIREIDKLIKQIEIARDHNDWQHIARNAEELTNVAKELSL